MAKTFSREWFIIILKKINSTGIGKFQMTMEKHGS